ncbi:MAG TPA: FAD-dependent oxidoreductase, partial [Methanocella sp.]|nr:FAD-dependent oxidoreductase [Methanocella sp.]
MDTLDTVIIGAGPAGMTAAIYAKRKGLSLALVAVSVGGNMGLIGDLENYPGFDSVAGAKLVARMRDQLQRLGVSALVDRVAAVEKAPGGYAVRTEGRRSFEARSVVVASGSHWRELGVPGEREFVNRGVSFCSTCDAPLFRGMDVAVVGGGNRAAESVLELTRIAAKVYVIVRSRLKADQVTVDKIRGNDK